MRRTFWLVVALAGCAGADSDPVDVAERFHTLRIEGDDRGVYALLTEADRAAFPLEAFPTELPSVVMMDLLGWGDAQADSASLLSAENDTAAVVLHVAGDERDTVRLVAIHAPLGFWRFELDRVRWRVSLGLAEAALLDSLAAAVGEGARPTDSAAVRHAEAYVQTAERFPDHARPADLATARSLVETAAVAEALRIQLRITQTIDGVHFVEGRIQNPTGRRVNTLILAVRDASGDEEEFELWGVPSGGSTPIRRITRLQREPLTHRVARIQLF